MNPEPTPRSMPGAPYSVLRRFILWITRRVASRPVKERVFAALTDLLEAIRSGDGDRGPVVPFDTATGKLIIFSDQHKGRRNGADDFAPCEGAYLAALEYYHTHGFTLILLGDAEELWEASLSQVRRAHAASFAKEGLFVPRNAFYKIYGNHDLQWDNDPFAQSELKEVFGYTVPVYEGVVLRTEVAGRPLDILCTHGHQGDLVSDGNWFSKFFVSRIWAPLQAWLRINPNTPAYDAQLKTDHNRLMYQWSAAQPGLLLITGHTHQPVFESLTHIERLYRSLLFARSVNDSGIQQSIIDEIRSRRFDYQKVAEDYLQLRPSYFNSGCCCYSDGDITGIELQGDCIRLVKWRGGSRQVLEEAPLQELADQLTG